MEQVNLKLSVEEANIILEALGQMPFKSVYGLINNIQQQAGQQVNKNGQQNGETTLEDNKEEEVQLNEIQ